MGEMFRRKARLVADGNETNTPAALTYSSVMSRESVRIALLFAPLHELEILECDIKHDIRPLTVARRCTSASSQVLNSDLMPDL